MANKTLTAKVRLETTDVESKIKRINKLINNVNKALNKTKASNLEKQLSRCGTQATKLRTKIGKVNSALSRTATSTGRVRTILNNTNSRLANVRNQTRQWNNAQRNVNNSLRSSNNMLGSIGSKLKSLVGAYLGLQTIKIGITASDTVTSAQNRLNNLDGGNPKQTAEAMDKIYTASQRARTGYDQMLNNVSKTMTLAPDAFQGNIDNAIRFQEIMSKAYTVGGATAQEQHTSMYQMVQALGSGILAGDELRSVREGAPIAYKEIEKFAQGVYNTTDSLKDMASEGMITSDMVVAAIMNAGDQIEKKFNNTKITFAQAWTQIKNTAMKAFQPALESLNKMLNSKAGKSMIEGISNALITVGNTLSWVIDKFSQFFNWCAENWGWLKHVIVAGLIIMAAYWMYQAGVAVVSCIKTLIAMGHVAWIIIIATTAVLGLIYVFYLWKTGAITTCEAIASALLIVGAALLLVGVILAIVTGGTWAVAMLVTGAIFLILGLIIMFFSEVCYGAGWMAGVIVNILSAIWNVVVWLLQAILSGVMWLLAIIVDIIKGCINVIIGIINFLLGSILWILATIYNIFVGCVNAILQVVWSTADPIIGVIEWILNACNGGFNSFGGAVANLIGQIISWFLSLGKVVTKIIDAIFGTNWTDGLSSLQDKVIGWGKKEDASITIDRTAPELKRIDATNAFSTGMGAIGYLDMVNPNSVAKSTWNDLDPLHTGYVSPSEWGDTAGKWGKGIEDKVNSWGSKFQNLNKAADGGLPDPNDPKYAVDGAYDPSGIMDKLGDIKGDTGDMKDAMQLENEDLEYMRKIAEMEWKNEFTTAEIKVDMTNHNTVNGERDLDGIVEYLSDVLREEMTSVAYGVHY